MRATPTRTTNDFLLEFFGNKLATIKENDKYPHTHTHTSTHLAVLALDGADFSVNDISVGD